jgi:hypothetical protein
MIDKGLKDSAWVGATEEKCNNALAQVIDALEKFSGATIPVIGYHCVSCFRRHHLLETYFSSSILGAVRNRCDPVCMFPKLGQES